MFSKLRIGRLVSGGLITNYFCTSACRHCLYNCGPGRAKQYIDPTAAAETLRRVKSLGCPAVHIGGGEPLLRPRELGEVLDAARRAGVSIDYVETNASWFTEADAAVALLSELRSKGLSTLLVSISPFHNEHIPLAKTLGVIQAARRAGVRILPWVTEFLRDLEGFDAARPHGLAEYEERYGGDYLRRTLDRYWIHMGGRALETFRPLLRSRTLEHVLRETPGNCARELTDTSHFHVDVHGNYIPGLCAGLAVALQDLGGALSEERYPLLTCLFARGIRGLHDMASKAGFSALRPGYLGKCDLCTDIRRWLVHNGSDGVPELRPLDFYSLNLD